MCLYMKNIGLVFIHSCFVLLLLILQPEGGRSQEQAPTPADDDYDSEQYKQFQHEKIFKEDICDIKCGSRPHTMCKTLEIPKCDKYEWFQIYELSYLKSVDLKDIVLDGHNGLRDRIANKMNAASIVEMEWDDDLAQMTIAYLMQCDVYEDDPCTKNVFTEKENQLDYYEKDLQNWVVQNRFHVDSEFFPNHFIEHAIQSWYFEKDELQRPQLHYVDKMNYYVGTLKGENNFTHLAYPLSFRVGCSMARVDSSYTLICNYYPFYRTAKTETIFISSEPTSNCPIYFPLPHEYFMHICTDHIHTMHEHEHDHDHDEATMLVSLDSAWIFCIVFALQFLW